MENKVTPVAGYVYGREIKIETGVVTPTEISDTKQIYEVLAIGGATLDDQVKTARVQALSTRPTERPNLKVGDIVIIQKHAAEGDTPPKMLDAGYALFLASRIMAIESK